MFSITLDWLAFTFKEDSRHAGEWLSLYASNQGSIPIAPTNGYRTAYRSTEGIHVMWNLDRAEMGYHVIIAGSAIRNLLKRHDLDQQTLIQTILDSGGSITRLDLAKDATDVQINLDAIYMALEGGYSVGTARKFAQMHSKDGGNTIYVGSRQSEKFIRIYNKAAESNLPGVLWYRYELETKGMVARAVASILTSTTGWADCFATYTKHMVDIPQVADYQVFFGDETVTIGIPKIEKKSDREAWIEKQVMPAVVKHFVENPDSKAVALLRAMLDQIDGQNRK